MNVVAAHHFTFHFLHLTIFYGGCHDTRKAAQKTGSLEKSHRFCRSDTGYFPKEEEFGLKSQLRRAAVSVPSNISEGLTRRTNKDKLHFLNIAQGSLSEIDAQLEISERLSFLAIDDGFRVGQLQTDVEKLLSGLIRSISKI
ncbi:MAG: four helix bundle protein [Bacteroidota bacterium]